MKWLAKAAAANLLSRCPGGDRVVYGVQRTLTRSLPMSEREFLMRADSAVRHLRSFRASVSAEAAGGAFLEFGAGWDLAVPLALRMMGVSRQILLDRDPLVRPELVRVTVERLRALALDPAAAIWRGTPVDPLRVPARVPAERDALLRWLEKMGIQYLAPCDARASGLPAGSISCATSTVTLEHIPEEDIALIFHEMSRLMAPGGVISFHVDMSDHYSHFDAAVTPWNFLRFDRRTWGLVNCDFLYQNRLRASAYERLAREAGFELVQAERGWPEGLDGRPDPLPRVHPSFTDWTDPRDLLATTLDLVGRSPGRGASAGAPASGRASTPLATRT